MINYHKGVAFDSYTINNTQGLYLLDVTEKAIPTPILRDGKIIDYEDRIIMLSVGIRGFGTNRTSKLQEVLDGITKAKKLQFMDSDKYFDIIAVTNIEQTYAEPFLQLDVTVTTKPYGYKDEPKKALTGDITNNGNYKAHTIMEVTGAATVNSQSINVPRGTLYINSEDKTAYTVENGKKINGLQYITGDKFLVLEPGINTIITTGDVNITYRHTYLY